jgi:hypothetical protein
MLAQLGSSSVTDVITKVCSRRGRATRLLLVASFSLLLLGAGGLPPAAADGALSAGQVLAHQEEPEEVTLTLRSDGFDPAEVVRPAGRFMLSVDNRSGVDKITLLLRRGDGSKVVEIKVLNGNGDWSESIELRPGRYTLSEADHPSWKCDFLINEKK